jgi:deoxyribodipyrimidine photo-lyase
VKNWSNLILDGSNISIDDFPTDISPAINGGRKEGLEILKNIKIQSKYNINRNQLSYNTTHLSAHNKFGTVSIREVYHAFKALPNGGSDLIKQLFWRDFYYNIMMHDPNALKGNYSSKFDGFPWNEPGENFNAWKEGRTGFPVVDACMRELNSTGYMHNRGRMIVADFLIKILRIDWRLGEHYFATKLIDYDPAQNNYNWQWVAGTAPFSQPYFRVFNPWTQAVKFDPECEYIKKWVSELRDVPCDIIHSSESGDNQSNSNHNKYIQPIVDYKIARDEYLLAIKEHLKNND